MTPELLEEYTGDTGREAVIYIIDEKLSMWRYSYEILLADQGKIVGKHETDILEYARQLANRWIKKGELTHGTK